ncbi:hypothetical protein TCDM_11261 [Trypanosoma cruzi Dm28c]|uniref:Uncharacterized protein n=1 Tax=Trypanosoma cruzi Dm28c TaxID=1416333 RepID=V5B9W1_TRYCR|nr:hypothetical protein TCDM_11261 [Trypanosoma cruzi Dm28c]
MRDSDRRCWVHQPPLPVANPRVDVTAQHQLAAQLSHQILCHPSLHGVAATDGCPSGQHRRSVQADGWLHRGEIDAATIHKGRRIYVSSHSSWRQRWPLPPSLHSWQHSCYMCAPHWPHGPQLTISAMHAHIKVTESVILTLSLSTGSRTLLPHTQTHAIAQAAVTRSTRHIHNKSTGTTTTSASQDTCTALPAATTQRTQSTKATRASKPSAIRDVAKKNTCHPVLNETRSPTQRSHTRCITPTGKDSGCALPPPLLPSPHGHGRRQQPPHATASMHCKRCIQIHRNVHLVCVCRNAKQRGRKREQSMRKDAQNVQQRRMAEVKRRRPLKLMTALQPKQRQFTKDLLKTKKLPPRLTNPITQNNYK